jgi:hypothetical protein
MQGLIVLKRLVYYRKFNLIIQYQLDNKIHNSMGVPFQIKQWVDDLIFGVLMPLSAIFQLYHGDQF